MTVSHYLRDLPPWDDRRLTECGLRADDVDEAYPWYAMTRAYQIGEKSSRCVDCAQRVSYTLHGDKAEWATNPSGMIANLTSADPAYLNADLHAMAVLVAKHRDEFEAIRWVSERRAKM